MISYRADRFFPEEETRFCRKKNNSPKKSVQNIQVGRVCPWSLGHALTFQSLANLALANNSNYTTV